MQILGVGFFSSGGIVLIAIGDTSIIAPEEVRVRYPHRLPFFLLIYKCFLKRGD